MVFKGGKTRLGGATAKSHTGWLAGDYGPYRAAFKQSGIIEADTVPNLFNISKVLDMQPLPKGNRIKQLPFYLISVIIGASA